MGRTVTPRLTTDATRTSNGAARVSDTCGREPAVVPAGASPDSRPVAVTTDLPALREDHAIEPEHTGES